MATNYGWAGQILRVDLTAGTCTPYPTNAFPVNDYSTGQTLVVDMTQYIGGRGIGYAIMAYEVPPGTRAFDPANRVIFGVGPITGSGSPSSGRTSVTSLHVNHKDELVDGGQFGGHWGSELKYAGYDAIVIQGKSPTPVWLKIQDSQVALEDASMLWGNGIYYSTNYITNLMGPESHVACIGPWSENLVRLSAVYTDRSHRGGGQAAILGAKNLKAIGVHGTGAVNIATDKKTWKSLINYYMSLLGCNNQGVVAKNLQPWSEYSPGGTRWSGAPGVLWGAATPPRDLGNCPDVEHPMSDAPTPINKIGLRTQKGYNDFSDEGMKRTVRMDGCHACPIRCHIPLQIPQLLNYGIAQYNMNTCMGNTGTNGLYTNTAGTNPTQNPVLLTYASNNIDDDYGLWNDYGATYAVMKWVIGQRVPNPNGGVNIPMLQKYLSAADWQMLTATPLWSSGLSPMGPQGYAGGTIAVTNGSTAVTGTGTSWTAGNGVVANGVIVIAGVSYTVATVNSATSLTLAAAYAGATASGLSYIYNVGSGGQSLLDNGDPRFIQFFVPYVAQNQIYSPPQVNAFGETVYGTLGYYYGIGCDRLAEGDSTTGFPGWAEVKPQMLVSSSLAIFKMGHEKHHSIESNGLVGALINFLQRNRDPNNHTWQCFYTNGLPGQVKAAICQELTTLGNSIFNAPDESVSGKFAFWNATTTQPVEDSVNWARVALAVQCIVNMELHNALTQCNYTLPVWASPLKSRNYRGDPTLEAQTYQAITGVDLTKAPVYSPIYALNNPGSQGVPPNPTPQMALETMALRNYTLFRCLTAIGMQQAAPSTVYNLQLTPAATWSQYTPLATAVPVAYQVVNQPGPTAQTGDGNNMRWSHDYAYPWSYGTKNGPGTPLAGNSGSATTFLDVMGTGNTEAAKSMAYDMLGWDRATGLPTQATLNALGLGYMIGKMQAVGIVVP